MQNLRIIVGPPGTGKTSFLKRQIERAAEKYNPAEIVACSYTKAAVRELCHRDLPIPDENIGTLHSIGYRALGCPDLLETAAGVKEFLQVNPRWTEYFTGKYEIDIDDIDFSCPALAEFNLHRSIKKPLHQWKPDLQHAYKAWCDYKTEREGIDYCDMIDLPLQQGVRPASDPRILFVDEAQDLTPLEADLVHFWGQELDQYFLVGDPDQSIFAFKGSAPETIDVAGHDHRVLSQSWRVPRAAHNIAQQIIRRNDDRVDVQYRPTEVEGEVVWHDMSLMDDPGSVADLALSLEGDVMVLATCAYMLQGIIKSLKERGTPFHNPFRRKRLDWNPVWQSNKKSANTRMITRLNALVKPKWTARDILLWESLTKGVFTKTSREILRDLPQDHELTTDQIGDIIGVEQYGEMFLDELNWLKRNLNKKSQEQCEYYFRLLESYPQGYHETPDITVGTIHSVKGGESKHVIIAPDISWNASLSDDWGELNRVFYVGATRTSNSLHLLAPSLKRNRREVGPGITWPESLTL